MKKITTFDNLPKYLEFQLGRKTMYFHPVIIKWENECSSNSYYAMYAKYNVRSSTLNLSKVLFWVSGRNYQEAEKAFLNKANEMHEYIKGKIWVGCAPQKLDLMNEKAY